MKSQWDSIYYDRGIIADRERGRAYLLGYGMPTSRFYVVSLDYTHPDAAGCVPLTLFYTDPMPEVGFPMPVLTAEGDMMLVGGSLDSNYVTYASVLLLRLGGHADKPQRAVTSWLWMTLLLIVLLCVALTIYLWRRRRKAVENDAEMPDSIGRLPSDAAFIQRICQYMDEQKPYLNAELKVADVAKALGTNSTYVSRSVNVMKGCTFSQFVNGYRINHAMQLIRQQPDIKITTVSAASGFATETSFFRCFKAQTGMTPKEWIAKSTYNT
jgi:AraC-like DNA-binding protein